MRKCFNIILDIFHNELSHKKALQDWIFLHNSKLLKIQDGGGRHLEFWELPKVAFLATKLILLLRAYRTQNNNKSIQESQFPGFTYNKEGCLLDYWPWSGPWWRLSEDDQPASPPGCTCTLLHCWPPRCRLLNSLMQTEYYV